MLRDGSFHSDCVLRNIDKAGGLDAYLKKIEGGREDSEMAETLRQRIRKEVQMRQLMLELAAKVCFNLVFSYYCLEKHFPAHPPMVPARCDTR
jgi:hypothetical protein